MAEEEIRRACYELITSIQGAQKLDYGTVTDETEIYNAGFNLDSLGLTELIGVLEKRFNIDIGDEIMETDTFENFGTVCKFVEEKTKK